MIFMVLSEGEGEDCVATTAEKARDVWAATLREEKPEHVAIQTFADGAA